MVCVETLADWWNEIGCISSVFSSKDTVPACDRRTDGHLCHGIVRVMHTLRAVIIKFIAPSGEKYLIFRLLKVRTRSVISPAKNY